VVELIKYNDLSKRNENDPTNYKKYRVDYRQDIRLKREENEKLKQELIRKIEEESQQGVCFSQLF